MQDKTNIIGVTNSFNSSKFSLPLEIHSMKSPFKTFINCHVVDKITCELPQTMIDPSKLSLAPNLVLADDEFYKPSEINMLIGADVFFQVLQPSHQLCQVSLPKEHPRSEPCQHGKKRLGVINTKFGHIIAGGLPPQKEVTKLISLLCTKCNSSINNTIKKFWQSEKVPEIFNENSSEQDLVEANFQSTVRLMDNKFQVDLPLKIPLKNVNETLGNSFDLALYRFLNLEKKLHKNITLYSDYKKFINEYIALGHAHLVDIESINFNTEPICFLPHHAVLNENSKTTRTRVVMDGSMLTNKKISLNDLLMNGPTVQRDLFDIVLLYRIGDYTFSSDIKKMFRQVLVNPLHTSLQNILWRERLDEPIKCICLDTVTFGLKSSNYLATRCLIELANKHEAKFPLASFILKNCTYVDDILYAHSELSTLLEAKIQLKGLLHLGGFELHKWSANHHKILADIPTEQQQFNEFELQKQGCNIKALGLIIDSKNDSFVIKGPEHVTDSLVTKRSILSKIAELYDPMGFVSPIIMQAKVIMQRIWLEKIDWDTPPSQQLIDQWLKFANGLSSFKPIYLNRNILSQADDRLAEAVQLIGFADAATTMGYGACVYLRVVQHNVQWEQNSGRCGVCGDADHLTVPRPHEAGGMYGKGIITKHYSVGQEIEVEVELTANHLGTFVMKLCPNNNPKQEATQECLDRYPLYISGTRGDRFLIPLDTAKKEIFRYRVRLPPYVTCTQCVLQWTYYTGNMWGICPNGTEAVGCGRSETFRNCADVSIVTSTGGLPPLFAGDLRRDNPFLLYYRDYNMPQNIYPLVIREQVCVPSEGYRVIPGMLNWCQTNCLRYPPHCPESLCTCPQECEAIGELEGREGADVYCMDQCIVYPPRCPKKRCRCY